MKFKVLCCLGGYVHLQQLQSLTLHRYCAGHYTRYCTGYCILHCMGIALGIALGIVMGTALGITLHVLGGSVHLWQPQSLPLQWALHWVFHQVLHCMCSVEVCIYGSFRVFEHRVEVSHKLHSSAAVGKMPLHGTTAAHYIEQCLLHLLCQKDRVSGIRMVL